MSSSQIYYEMSQYIVPELERQRWGYLQQGKGIGRISDISSHPGVYGLDCEMCTSHRNGEYVNEVVRITIVNHKSEVVYDEIVRPRLQVVDYNTRIHGIGEAQIENGITFKTVMKSIHKTFYSNTIFVGHSLEHDLRALNLTHNLVVDVSLVYPSQNPGQKISLKNLALAHLGRSIQNGSHDSVEDAEACMDLMLKKIGRL